MHTCEACSKCLSHSVSVHTAVIALVAHQSMQDCAVELASWPETGRPLVWCVSQVMRLRLGDAEDAAECLLEEHDPERYMMLSSSLDAKFVTINSNSKTSSEVIDRFMAAVLGVSPKLCWEHMGTSGMALINAAAVLWLLQVWLLRTDDPSSPPAIVQPRSPGLEYFVSHHAGHLLIVTNAEGAANYKLAAAPVGSAGMGAWQTLVPERPGVAIEDCEVFEGHAVLYERHGGRQGVSVLSLSDEAGQSSTSKLQSSANRPEIVTSSAEVQEVTADQPLGSALGGNIHSIAMPAWATSVTPAPAMNFCADTLKLSVSSPVHPEHCLDYRFESQHLTCTPSTTVPGWDPAQLTCSILHATAADGAQVSSLQCWPQPLFLHRTGDLGLFCTVHCCLCLTTAAGLHCDTRQAFSMAVLVPAGPFDRSSPQGARP